MSNRHIELHSCTSLLPGHAVWEVMTFTALDGTMIKYFMHVTVLLRINVTVSHCMCLLVSAQCQETYPTLAADVTKLFTAG